MGWAAVMFRDLNITPKLSFFFQLFRSELGGVFIVLLHKPSVLKLQDTNLDMLQDFQVESRIHVFISYSKSL